MKNAKRGGGEYHGVCFDKTVQSGQFCISCVCVFSSRNYVVPDPPGLFDGHVWPMYVKHKKLMEDMGVDVGKRVSECVSVVSNRHFLVVNSVASLLFSAVVWWFGIHPKLVCKQWCVCVLQNNLTEPCRRRSCLTSCTETSSTTSRT